MKGESVLETMEGVPDEDVGKGATLDNQLTERKSAIVGHGQNLVRVGTVLQNSEWHGALGQVWSWRTCKLYLFSWHFKSY